MNTTLYNQTQSQLVWAYINAKPIIGTKAAANYYNIAFDVIWTICMEPYQIIPKYEI